MIGGMLGAGAAPDCPIDALPELLREAALEVLSLEPQVPLACLLTDALAAASAVVQIAHDVRGLDHRTMPTTINTLAAVPSGLGKGTSFNEFLGPLDRHALSAPELDDLRRGEEPNSPQDSPRSAPPLAFLQDQSYKGLLRDIEGVGRAATIQHEDGLGFLESDLVYKHADRLTQLWSGQAALRLATARERRFAIDARCSVGVRVQNKIFEGFLKRRGEKAYHIGLLPRFIVGVHSPQSSNVNRATRLHGVRPGALERLHKRLKEITEESASTGQTVPFSRKVIELDAAAAQFMRWLKEHTFQGAQGSGFLAPSWSRAWENTLRVAAVFHVVTNQGERVSLETVQAAWLVVHWSLSQHELVFGSLDASRGVSARERIHARMASHEQRLLTDMGIVLGVVAQRERTVPPFGVTLLEVTTFSGISEARAKTALARLVSDGSVWISPERGGTVSLSPGDPRMVSVWR